MARQELHEAQWAYHVTDIREHDPREYTRLTLTTADDAPYDGALLGLRVVFFTTTLMQGELPRKSHYPRKGEKGRDYKRVQVPLSRWNNHEKMLLCKTDHPEQVRIVLATKKEAKLFEGHPRFASLDPEKNPCLTRTTRKDGTIQWKTTNRTDQKVAWVNFVVLREVPIDNECVWSKAKRSDMDEGMPMSRIEFEIRLQTQWAFGWRWALAQNKKREEVEVVAKQLEELNTKNPKPPAAAAAAAKVPPTLPIAGLPVALQSYIMNGFPPTRSYGGGDYVPGCDKDEICRLCGKWVTENSSCSNRYFQMQGLWLEAPPFDPRVSPDEDAAYVATVPICDKCCSTYCAYERDEIEVMGHTFMPDVVYRMND